MSSSKSTAYQIFKSGSVTFFTASLFFPAGAKKDVFDLYAFVRVFDDYVDKTPQQSEKYYEMKQRYYSGLSGSFSGNAVLDNFILLQKKCRFNQDWVDAFFRSMEMDLEGREYKTLGDTEDYMYGSAEVIGLMMSAVMRLPALAYPYAQLLGKAFQYMNFLRDVKEDLSLGRIYIPVDVRKNFDLEHFTEEAAHTKRQMFEAMMRQEIHRYREWMREARSGFHYIPKSYRIPIASASDMFDHVIDKIEQNPLSVFSGKVTPSRLRILGRVAYHSILS